MDRVKAVVGTSVAGLGASLLLGINLIGFAAFVGLGTFFVAIPVVLYLIHTDKIDSDRVFKAGITFGVGSYLFAVVALFLFDAFGIEDYLLPVRVATIPVGGYLVAYRFSAIEAKVTRNLVNDYVKTTIGTLVGGLGVGFVLGDSFPLLTTFVVGGTFLVALPSVLYLTRNDRIDANRTLIAGVALGAGPLFLPPLAFALGWGLLVLAIALTVRKRM